MFDRFALAEVLRRRDQDWRWKMGTTDWPSAPGAKKAGAQRNSPPGGMDNPNI